MPSSPNQISISEAREQMIAFVTERWVEQLRDLGAKLRAQGFGDDEISQIEDSYRPMFEENLTAAIKQFDHEAHQFAIRCDIEAALKKFPNGPEADA